MKQLKSGMTGLAFAKVINENAAELGTTEKLKFERMSANHLANTINEQLAKVGSDKEVSFKTSKVVEVYNEEVVNHLVSSEPEASTFSLRPETTEDETGDETSNETDNAAGDETGLGNEDETTGEGVDVVTTEEDENV